MHFEKMCTLLEQRRTTFAEDFVPEYEMWFAKCNGDKFSPLRILLEIPSFHIMSLVCWDVKTSAVIDSASNPAQVIGAYTWKCSLHTTTTSTHVLCKNCNGI
jgi:hypothetical protein